MGLLQLPTYPHVLNPKPQLSVNLQQFGFRVISDQQWAALDQRISRAPRPSLLESLDLHARIEFLSNSVLVVYRSQQLAQDSTHQLRVKLRAFFLDTGSGAMLDEESWPSRLRYSQSDQIDSEGRIMPLKDGEFLVHAADKLMLFSRNFRLKWTRDLETRGRGEKWSIQPLVGGTEVFVRHESENEVEYSWRTIDSFESVQGLSFDASNYLSKTGALATTQSLFSFDKRYPVSTKDSPHFISCPFPSCKLYSSLILNGDEILESARYGFAVLSSDGQHTLWSKRTTQSDGVSPTLLGRSLDGDSFFLAFESYRGSSKLDGIRLSENGTLIVYGPRKKEPVFVSTNRESQWENGAALSPDGSKLALLKGTTLELYSLSQ